jgi:adenylate cyclase
VAQHQEIERKFLVRQPPPGWKQTRRSYIAQGYLPVADKELEIRLRRKDLTHCITIKRGHGRRRVEEEIGIPKATFRSLWPLTRTARIAKWRYEIPWNGQIVEMDVYLGPHRGLITAEIEFDSDAASRSFHSPEWLGREITGNRRYTNQALARKQHPLRIRREA